MCDCGRTDHEFDLEAEPLGAPAYEADQEVEAMFAGEAESPFDESEETELAVGLLEVRDEAALDQFLGRLIQRASRAVGRLMRSPQGRSLGGILKSVARSILPAAGGGPGTPGAPGVGTTLASDAGPVFGLELEGLSPEDQELEVARRFVRFAGAATGKAAVTPPDMSPRSAAQVAVAAAARRHAPGLRHRRRRRRRLVGGGAVVYQDRGEPDTRQDSDEPDVHRCECGRLIRHGRKVVVINF